MCALIGARALLLPLLLGLAGPVAGQAVGHPDHRFSGAQRWATLFDDPARDEWQKPEEVLRALCDELADQGGGRGSLDDRLDAVRATVACHSVVRAGDLLSPAEAEALLASLDGVDFKAHCPHGRPVLLRISVAEIARRFGRT